MGEAGSMLQSTEKKVDGKLLPALGLKKSPDRTLTAWPKWRVELHYCIPSGSTPSSQGALWSGFGPGGQTSFTPPLWKIAFDCLSKGNVEWQWREDQLLIKLGFFLI